MTKPLIVQKYGGSSLAEPQQIRDVASRIAKLHQLGHPLLIVVSAMGKTTDELVHLALRVSASPNRRELDMLLTTGERVSMSLMSMALSDLGCKAISFTGSQAGVFTDELHSNARITDIRPMRVQSELEHGNIVVLAGFQGVSPSNKEITTLGRGGSDTTAVAMAAHFRAERCEIRKDVDGIYSADPHLVANARHIHHINYKCLLDMTYWGAKVLHYRSVELALHLKIPVLVALAHETSDQKSTIVDGEAPMYEQAEILSVNSHTDVRWIEIQKTDFATAIDDFSQELKAAGLPMPQLLDSEKRGNGFALLITAPRETLDAIIKLSSSKKFRVDTDDLSTVTATCQGSFASLLPQEIASTLHGAGIEIKKMIFSAMSITALVNQKDREHAVKILAQNPV